LANSKFENGARELCLVKAEFAAGNKGVGLLALLCPISERGRPVARPGRLVPTLRGSLRRGLEGGRRLECG